MQRSEITTGTHLVTETSVPNCGKQLRTAQVVADYGDTLSVVAQGTQDAFTVQRDSLQSYESVYGNPIPRQGDQPVKYLGLK